MAVVKIIIILQRVVQMHVWNSNDNSETEKGKTAAFHTRTCTHTRANSYAHVHTCTQMHRNLYKKFFMEDIF